MKVRIASFTTIRSGFMTSRIDRARAVAQDAVHRDQVARQALDVVEHGRRPAAACRTACGRTARACRCEGRIRSSHQVTTSGNERSRSVSPVGAQSTITQSNSPSSWWRLIQSSENSSSMPGRHGQLLGRDAVDAALREQVAEPGLHARPSGAPSPPAPAPPAPNRFAPDVRGLGAELGLERVGQAVRRVGREHDGAQARRRRSGARWRRRRSSCRRRPCPCRGSCAAPSGAAL